MSVYACGGQLARTAVAAKSNEVTGIPEVPDLGGTTGTIDVISCRKDLVRHVQLQQTDHVLTVKDH